MIFVELKNLVKPLCDWFPFIH